ncbi:hypothetical protein LTR85_005849 [Meristemomyces frigidus]|nr:hypothetical protein LTR85_005849 [Meristemomyces frigidus]
MDGGSSIATTKAESNVIRTQPVARSDTQMRGQARAIGGGHDETTVAQDCKLLSIPPEIRNYIYGLALTESDDIVVPSSGKLSQPALLRVCKQVRTEALAIYYASNNFRSRLTYPATRSLCAWVDHIDETITKHIHSLILEFDYMEYPHESNTTICDIAGARFRHQLAQRLFGTTSESERDALQERYWLERFWLLLHLRRKGLELACISIQLPDLGNGRAAASVRNSAMYQIAASTWIDEVQQMMTRLGEGRYDKLAPEKVEAPMRGTTRTSWKRLLEDELLDDEGESEE